MVFSSTIFIFGFLPLVLFCYFLAPGKVKNYVLFAASIFFYAWGELFYSLLMMVSILGNYTVGLCVDRSRKYRKHIVVVGVTMNLLFLGFFKYANFLVDSVNSFLGSFVSFQFHLSTIHLPIGISFFTFQAISYIIDVYRKETPVQRNFWNLGLYISLFPQLIAGPIVRYNSIAAQLVSRNISIRSLEIGVSRFIYGLAKKVLIANPMGEVADSLFALPVDQLPTNLALVAVISFSLQIYFDFSGYSDMAIGLGKMFGFTFPENFNYPYIARSVREFWRRWHISLTTWFRDYLYIPLGGNRVAPGRIAFNLLTVFVLCGFWHGASWNYLVWGLWHGMFLVLERAVWGKWLEKIHSVYRHVYTLFVVCFGWVFFRIEDMGAEWEFIQSLLGKNGIASQVYPLQLYISNEAIIAGFAGVLLSMPIFNRFCRLLELKPFVEGIVRVPLVTSLLFLSIIKISSGTYNPFIYFRF